MIEFSKWQRKSKCFISQNSTVSQQDSRSSLDEEVKINQVAHKMTHHDNAKRNSAIVKLKKKDIIMKSN